MMDYKRQSAFILLISEICERTTTSLFYFKELRSKETEAKRLCIYLQDGRRQQHDNSL